MNIKVQSSSQNYWNHAWKDSISTMKEMSKIKIRPLLYDEIFHQEEFANRIEFFNENPRRISRS